MASLSMNEMDRVGYFLDELQDALPMDSGWYCWTNRIDYGLQIAHGTDDYSPKITLKMDGTWEFTPKRLIADALATRPEETKE